MLSALIAIAGSLLGVVLGFFAQHLQADLAHRRHLGDLKREAYAELLRAVSASYVQAVTGGGTSEDAAIFRARAVIELLADAEIGSAARNLEHLVGKAHGRLREAGFEAARADVEAADEARLELIRLFKADLEIRQRPANTAAPHGGSEPAAPAIPAADLAEPIAHDDSPDPH